MPQNLIRATWTDLDSDELRLFLRDRFGGGLGQYDGDNDKLHLPFAGAESRIVLTFAGNKISAVEPGEAFDAVEWGRVSQEIERSILAGTPKTGRDYSFSSLSVQGSWRGRRSGVQILPAPDGAPRSAGAHDPFILEFPIKGSDLWLITNHRRIREHRNGRDLRVPADLDESICCYLGLSSGDTATFDRATFWLDMSSRQWTISVSAAFAAYVSAIEALTERGITHQFDCPVCGKRTQHEVPSATRRFKDFIDTYAPGAGLATSRDEMYALRSGILHGSKLIELDYALAFGWDPPWLRQGQLVRDLSAITRIALRNWLKDHAASASA